MVRACRRAPSGRLARMADLKPTAKRNTSVEENILRDRRKSFLRMTAALPCTFIKDIGSFCPGQEKSLLQGRICVPDKRNLYYRVAFLYWKRDCFTTGVHLCPGQEKSLLQGCMSVLDKRNLYYRGAYLRWTREIFTTGTQFCNGQVQMASWDLDEACRKTCPYQSI